ncbi:MAG TPA: CHASE domain-containing protein, partial [Rhodocyclaceae bacterium]|nr:CHASE domain-containing protein [Rhodocyclaceae bacterium]
SVHFLEPFSGKNLRAFGFDMLTDPVRRVAMESARDTAGPTFSGRVKLLQDDEDTTEAGVLVYYPVYHGNDVPKSLEQRRSALTGWVYLALRMNELMEALLSQQLQDVRLEIFDGDNLSPDSLIYDSLHVQSRPVSGTSLQRTTRLQLDGRTWTLRYSALPGYGSNLRADTAWVILSAMVVICLLLFGMTWAFVNTRERAQSIASRLTQSLSSSEERYRSIFSRSGVTSLLVNPLTCSVVEANEAAVNYYGIAAVDMRGLPLTELVMLAENDLRVALDAASQQRRNHVFQQHRLKSGLVREVEMHVGPINLDGRPLLYCVVHDITERHEAENAVLELNQRYQALLDAASEVAIVATDTEGLITVFNRGAERLLGYAAGEIVERMTPIAFHDIHEVQARSEELSTLLGYSIAGFKTFVELPLIHGSEQREWSYVRKDGSRCRVSLSVTPVRALDGRITGYLSIALDISRLKEVEASLVQAKEAAEQANRAKSVFLATMSHEIRTPMNGVIGMAQLLQGTTLTTEQQEYAEIIMASAESLLIIINDILDFSKVEAGKLELELLPFEMRSVLSGVVGLFAQQVRERDLELHLEVDANLPQWVSGDAARLRQVLVNLLGNAIKFTQNGAVHVGVSVIRLQTDAVTLALSVRDTGVGMAPEVVSGLFAPFYQGDSSITRRFGGTGLGLSITHGLVELMGGTIAVESTQGIGSVFTVNLTLPLPTEIPSAVMQAAIQAFPETVRVLVADDTITNQKVALQMLNKLGLQGVVVSNGEEAIRTLARGAFDLVLMDCQMPVMDGFATTEKIRAGVAGKQHQQVPIIAMTANALAGDRERCLKAGMNDYLPKPIVLDELRHKALRWLSVTQQHAAPVASSVDSAELPVFDVSELLRNCGQDRDLALAVIDAALFETTSYLTELGRLLGQADTLAVASQCHVLTGLFAQLSGKRLAAILRRLEAAARLGDMPSMDVMLTLGREYEALQLALHGFRNA